MESDADPMRSIFPAGFARAIIYFSKWPLVGVFFVNPIVFAYANIVVNQQ